MNRTEILKLALDKAATPQEAMALAREMDAFLAGGAPALALPAPEAPLRPYTHKPAPNARTSWTEADVAQLTDLYTNGKSVDEIARIVGRTPKAIFIALVRLQRGVPFGTRRAGE
jgi:hypothetical protein